MSITKSICHQQALLLEQTGIFLLHRHLGYSSIHELFHSDCDAYFTSKPVKFIMDHQFPYPIESVQAFCSTNQCYTEIKYKLDLNFSTERLIYDPESLKIKYIDTTNYGDFDYDTGKSSSFHFKRRINVCGGVDEQNSIDALKSARLLCLATRFLKADVTQDLNQQSELLNDDAIAFGTQGKQNILDRQREGIASGTIYSLPFPLQLNIDADCVSLDFYAYNTESGVKQRGTDIMYLDMRDEKVVRIDTLRHTLHQPEWVKQHFNL